MSEMPDPMIEAKAAHRRLVLALDAINPRLYKRVLPYLDAISWAIRAYPTDHDEIGDPDDCFTVQRRAALLRNRMRLYAIRCDVETMFPTDADEPIGYAVIDAINTIYEAVDADHA